MVCSSKLLYLHAFSYMPTDNSITLDSVQVAVSAESELNGRSFGANTVETAFFSEEDFAKGNLK